MCTREGTLQAYIDGELEPAERDAVVRHLAVCERCRERAAIAAERRDRVAGLITGLAPDVAADSAVVALARFRSRVSAEPTRAPRLGLALKAWMTAGALATAAVGLAVALHAIPGLQWLIPSHRAASVDTAPGLAGLAPNSATTAALPEIRTPVERPSPTPGRRTVRRAATDVRYVLLSEDAWPPEMGMVVRMKIPLSVLASGGVDADLNRSYGEIQADVLVGQDGRARALRLVNQSLTPGRK